MGIQLVLGCGMNVCLMLTGRALMLALNGRERPLLLDQSHDGVARIFTISFLYIEGVNMKKARRPVGLRATSSRSKAIRSHIGQDCLFFLRDFTATSGAIVVAV